MGQWGGRNRDISQRIPVIRSVSSRESNVQHGDFSQKYCIVIYLEIAMGIDIKEIVIMGSDGDVS